MLHAYCHLACKQSRCISRLTSPVPDCAATHQSHALGQAVPGRRLASWRCSSAAHRHSLGAARCVKQPGTAEFGWETGRVALFSSAFYRQISLCNDTRYTTHAACCWHEPGHGMRGAPSIPAILPVHCICYRVVQVAILAELHPRHVSRLKPKTMCASASSYASPCIRSSSCTCRCWH